MQTRSHQNGFTLVELMLTLAVAAILTSVAVPSYRSFTLKNRLATTTNDIVADINIARSNAVKLGQEVILCNSTDSTSIPPSCASASKNWTTGWIMFVNIDKTSNNKVYNNGTDRLLRVNSGGNSDVTIKTNTEGNGYISYASDGSISAHTVTSPATTLVVVCDSRGASEGKQIKINPTGRPRLMSPATNCSP